MLQEGEIVHEILLPGCCLTGTQTVLLRLENCQQKNPDLIPLHIVTNSGYLYDLDDEMVMKILKSDQDQQTKLYTHLVAVTLLENVTSSDLRQSDTHILTFLICNPELEEFF